MPAVKSLDRISRKWIRQSEAAAPEYKFGVENPKKDWAQATKDAEGNYKAGVIKAANEGRFGKGVAKAGTNKWQKNAAGKGADRWPAGIANAQGDYEAGFAPYREALINLNLPPRGPKGDPKNIQRVAAVAKALHEKKLELKGRTS
jgi:hypothetical protein